MTADEATDLRDLALTVAREAATLVRGRREQRVDVAYTKTSAVDVVTEADGASEELIRSLLRRARPDDAFLGEEGGGNAGTSGVRWVVDPIDGTVNFFYGLPQYAVSVAAELDGESVAGAVINAATGVEYAAALGAGATRDGRPIAVRRIVPLAERLVITGFAYEAERRAVQAAALVRLLPRVRDIRRLGSSALDVCHVAEGLADCYVEEGVHLWDHAAAGLIAREAGARTAVLPGAGGMDALVAAPSAGFEEFLAAVTDAGFLAIGPDRRGE